MSRENLIRLRRMRDKIEEEHIERISSLSRIERHIKLLGSLSDIELLIYRKNVYYSYYERNAVWPITDFLDNCPELATDPVFSKMHDLYQEVHEADKFVDCGITKPLKSIRDSLDKLATKMANRTMTKQEYTSLLEEKHEVFKKGYTILESYKLLSGI